MEALFYKDPTAVLDYAVDWSTYLGTAEAISTYAVAVDSSLVTITTHSLTSDTITAWVSGGIVGSVYTVSVKIETDASRTDERSFKIKIKQR